MSELASKTCIPCKGGVSPLKGDAVCVLQKQVEGWEVVEEHHLFRTFKFPDFRKALEFVNRVGAIAEEQSRHPVITFTWGKADITIYTHKINDLTESDFILAAKIDTIRIP